MTNENQGCLAVVLQLLGIQVTPGDKAGRGGGSPADELPYRLRESFLSAAEVSFYHVLRRVAAERYVIAPKVRVADLLYVVQRQDNMKFVNRIDRKHVDFVLCDPATMQPRLVIELDDASHARPDRKQRDDLIDDAFAAAEFPVLHVSARRAYSPDELAQQINGKLGSSAATPAGNPPSASLPGPLPGALPGPLPGAIPVATPAPLPAAAIANGGPPRCRKCGIAMIERRASKGRHQGQRFWACPSYPECREIVPIDA